jgi:predicted ATP-grasp superfamily ATP-dependent carboligase
MKRVFVFEYLTGGGQVDGDAAATQALLPQGLRMRDAMVGDLLRAGGFEVTAATCGRAPAPPAGARPCVAQPDESLFDLVAWQAALHDAVWLVAPETGGLLAPFAQQVPSDRWQGCDAAAIRLASSKSATLAHLAAHGLRTPLAFEGQTSRWVVKPDDGAGAVATTVHRSLAAAREARRAGAMTLEPWVDGHPMSLSLHCRDGRAELLSINRQRIDIDGEGRLAYAGVDIDCVPRDGAAGTALAELAGRVMQAVPGLRGFVGIDLVWHAARGPVLIELNPRLTCAYVGLSARLGRNLAAELLAEPRREPLHADA